MSDSMVDQARVGRTTPETEAESLELQLSDLLPDASGEIVLFVGDDLSVNLVVQEPIAAEGVSPAHVTATGFDVTGLHFYSFQGGLTVYSPADLQVILEL